MRSSAVPSLRRLSVPIVISGASGAMRKRLTSALRRRVRQHQGAHRAPAHLRRRDDPGGTTGRPAATWRVSSPSGDITIAAVGTTTSVCGDTVLGFGHPMTAEGKVAYGAARASSITIVDDPAGTPFKLANIGRLFGLPGPGPAVGHPRHHRQVTAPHPRVGACPGDRERLHPHRPHAR